MWSVGIILRWRKQAPRQLIAVERLVNEPQRDLNLGKE
jgi:hypothetical protein